MTQAPIGHSFRVRAMNANGQIVVQAVDASSKASAHAKAEQNGLVVLEVLQEKSGYSRGRKPNDIDLILLMEKLSALMAAGVPMIEAVESLRDDVNDACAKDLSGVAAALRQGSSLGDAMRLHMSYLPAYAVAFIQAGQETGDIAGMLARAKEQMQIDHDLRADLIQAITYPTFLLVSATFVVGFLLVFVVPQFSSLVSDDFTASDPISAFVFGLSASVQAHPIPILALFAFFCLSVWAIATQPKFTKFRNWILEHTPLFGRLLQLQRKTRWSRILSHSIAQKIALVRACDLAFGALDNSALAANGERTIAFLRLGQPIDVAFSSNGLLTTSEASLVRVGQRAGALHRMFELIAQRSETEGRRCAKQVSTAVEQISLAFVALSVGLVVVAVASSLSSVYESVG